MYRLNTVTYGTAPALFLATRMLKQLAIAGKEIFPEASVVLMKDSYVDDLLTGTNTITEANFQRDNLTELSKRGGSQLRQWASNEQK